MNDIYSVSPIYRGRVYRGIGYIAVACWTPFFCPPISRILQTWRLRARYFSQNRGNSLHSIRGRQFFAKSAHRDSLCSCSLETIVREINSSLPVNAGWNTCCAMGSHARWSIDTSIVSQSRVQLIQCQCKLRLQTANLAINNAFKGILINSEKVCDSAHSRCSYLLFPTAGAISTCWGIQIASYPDIINENFVSHGAEIWPSNHHFGHVDPV